MLKTTIQTDKVTLGYVKLFCNVKNIHQKDFLKYILDQNKEFKEFVKNSRKLKV